MRKDGSGGIRNRRTFVGLLSFLVAVSIYSSTASAEEGLALPGSLGKEDPLWSVFIFGGTTAEANTFVGLMAEPWSGSYGRNDFIGGAVSRRIGRVRDHFIFEVEVGAGERFKHFSSPEGWVALYLRFDWFPWNNFVYTTVAINTGLDYVQKVSPVELDSCLGRGNPNCSNLLHYLGPEITFASPDNPNSEIVIRWHHRSGIFGLMSDTWGGSNILPAG